MQNAREERFRFRSEKEEKGERRTHVDVDGLSGDEGRVARSEENVGGPKLGGLSDPSDGSGGIVPFALRNTREHERREKRRGAGVSE